MAGPLKKRTFLRLPQGCCSLHVLSLTRRRGSEDNREESKQGKTSILSIVYLILSNRVLFLLYYYTIILLYLMLTHDILRTHMYEDWSFRETNLIFDFSRSNQMPKIDQMTEIAHYVRTYF